MMGGRAIPRVLWVLPAGFCVLAAVCLYHYFRAAAMEDWPSIAGQSTAVRVEARTDSTTSQESGRRGRYYELVVDYRYQLDGKQLVGSDTKEFDTRSEADAEQTRYTPGAAVTIYYDPGNRTDSTLFKYPSAPHEFLWMIAAGAASALTCYIILWRVMGRKRGVVRQGLKHPLGR